MLIGAVVLLSLWAVASVVMLVNARADVRFFTHRTALLEHSCSEWKKVSDKADQKHEELKSENTALKAQNTDLQQQLFSEIARLAAVEAALKAPPMTDHFKD